MRRTSKDGSGRRAATDKEVPFEEVFLDRVGYRTGGTLASPAGTGLLYQSRLGQDLKHHPYERHLERELYILFWVPCCVV